MTLGEFIHDWRRKAGCVTLVMAALLTGLWIRSFLFYDLIWVEASGASCRFVSGAGSFRVVMAGVQFETLAGWVDHPLVDVPVSYGTYRGSVDMTDANTAYWPIVLPLALLSTYLLIWSGKRTERKLNVPADTGRAVSSQIH